MSKKRNHQSVLSKSQLFVMSTMPIWLILLVRNIPCDFDFSKCNLVSKSVLVCSFLLLMYGLYVVYGISYRLKGSPDSLAVPIKEIKDKTSEYVNTLSTLFSLFPFACNEITSCRDLVVAVVEIGIVYVCFTHSNLYYSNPILPFFGLKIGEVVTADDCQELPTGSVVIYKDEFKKTMSPYRVDNKVYFLV